MKYYYNAVFYFLLLGVIPVLCNFHMRTCTKFLFANTLEAMHERSLVRVKIEPCSTSCLSSALFILPLVYLLG